MRKDKQQYSFQEVLSKLMKYCSYQERSALELERKALKLGADSSEIEALLDSLKKENFYNEKRFVESFVRGKLNVKKWGKYKIIEGLKAKGVSNSSISEVLQTIPEETYMENLIALIDKRVLVEIPTKKELAKQYRYFMNRGYDGSSIRNAFEKKGWL